MSQLVQAAKTRGLVGDSMVPRSGQWLNKTLGLLLLPWGFPKETRCVLGLAHEFSVHCSPM